MSGNRGNIDKKDEDIGKLVFKRAGRTVEVDPETLRKPRLYVPIRHDLSPSPSANQGGSPLVQTGGHRPTVETPKHTATTQKSDTDEHDSEKNE